MIYSSRCSERI